jgi:hypothetical protein
MVASNDKAFTRTFVKIDQLIQSLEGGDTQANANMSYKQRSSDVESQLDICCAS